LIEGRCPAIRRFIERDSPRCGRLVAERLVEATIRLETWEGDRVRRAWGLWLLENGVCAPVVRRIDLR
jgi:hypothetical protein